MKIQDGQLPEANLAPSEFGEDAILKVEIAFRQKEQFFFIIFSIFFQRSKLLVFLPKNLLTGAGNTFVGIFNII